jgi:protocatechuate 3,4-dioxygenase, alpha subunit
MSAKRIPSQTIGPFFHLGLDWKHGGRVTFAEKGQRVVLVGRIADGAGQPVGDAMVETWQLSPEGRTPAPASGSAQPNGMGRVQTSEDGSFRIETLMPGGDAPHLDVTFFARGLLRGLRTRVYLAPEEAVRKDPALASIAKSPRVKTLVATPAGKDEYHWEVRLQGEGETVFFAA